MMPIGFENYEVKSNHDILEVVLRELPDSMGCSGHYRCRCALAHAHRQTVHFMMTPSQPDRFMSWLKGDAKVSDRQLFVYLRWIMASLAHDMRKVDFFDAKEWAQITSMHSFLREQLEFWDELPPKLPVINPPDDGPSYWYH